jgi:predicted RND superfamily exporter protein
MRGRKVDAGAALARVASFSARRATLVVAAATLLALAGFALALTLDPGRASSAAGDGGGDSAAATRDLREKFGGDPVVVLVRGRLTGMLLTEDVARMLSLEGCISGNVPRGARPAAPVCREFARSRPVQVVYGPGTFINEAANQVLDRIKFDRAGEAAAADRAGREARRVARRRGLTGAQQEEFVQEARRIVTANYAQRALELALRFGLSSVPALNNPEFVLQLVFEPSLGAEVPKPRFAYLFPHSDAAVIQARLRPGLSADERGEAVDMIRTAVAAKPFELKFGDYVVSGSPVVAEGVAAGLSDAAPVLVLATLLLVAIALALAFRRRPLLLPLAVGGGATAITLGGVAILGGAFSVGVAAALPLLWALGAVAALEVQRSPETAPRVGLLALITAAGFAALLLSPVSMTRELGAVVAVGLMVSFVMAVALRAAVVDGRAQLAARFAPVTRRVVPLRGRLAAAARRGGAPLRGRRRRPRRSGRRRRDPTGRVAAASRKARSAVRGAAHAVAATPARASRFARAAWRDAHERPGRVLRIAVVVALAGWVAATQIDVTSDQSRLLPADRLEARDLASIERETGTPGDVNLIVRSDRLLDPEVVRWMSSYQRRVLRQNGFRAGRPCGEADLCPALSLTNLFAPGRQSARQIREAVDALPRYFSQNVITPDRRTANIAFRMGAMPPEDRQRVVDALRRELDPPAGVDAQLAGPVVTAADGEDDIATAMWVITLAALAIAAAAAAIVARSYQAAALAAIPLGLAAGWAFLILFLLPVAADFLTTTVAALVVAVCAGPAVLAARRGRGPLLRDLLAPGAVAVGGFLALTVSGIPSLRDLGVAGALAVPLSGLGLVVSIPATLAWAQRRGGVRPSLKGVVGQARRAGAAVRRGVPRAGRKVRALALRR